MSKKHTYFRPTTAQQRRLLFETWETTGDVEIACQQAHVCPATFYYWKPRFETGGYAALEKPASHAPKSPHKTCVGRDEIPPVTDRNRNSGRLPAG